jgi:hypothetical protein
MKEHAGGPSPIAFSKGKKLHLSTWQEDAFDVDIHPVEQFDWEKIEAAEAGSQEFDWSAIDPDIKADVREQALTISRVLLTNVFDWIFSGGDAMPRGVMIRSYIVAWSLLPYMQSLKQTDLTRLMGLKDKQSVGRNASEFRDRFKVMNAYMQSEKARHRCREREAKKGRKKAAKQLEAHKEQTATT